MRINKDIFYRNLIIIGLVLFIGLKGTKIDLNDDKSKIAHNVNNVSYVKSPLTLKGHVTMTDRELEEKFIKLKNRELKDPPSIEELNKRLKR
jgi:hypothetical protein